MLGSDETLYVAYFPGASTKTQFLITLSSGINFLNLFFFTFVTNEGAKQDSAFGPGKPF
jgi:hypothetical protein